MPMIRFVLIFSAAHFVSALALGYILQMFGAGPSGALGGVAILAAGYVVGWRFTKLRRRLMSDQEMWRLIVGCAVYMVLFETLGVWGNLDTLEPLSRNAWIGVVALTVALDLLFLWLVFRFAVRKAMRNNLEKDAHGR